MSLSESGRCLTPAKLSKNKFVAAASIWFLISAANPREPGEPEPLALQAWSLAWLRVLRGRRRLRWEQSQSVYETTRRPLLMFPSLETALEYLWVLGPTG